MSEKRERAALAESLRTLSFGAPAAERDIGQGLGDYFVESPEFLRVRDGKKTVVLGNRGTGKSAIFKILGQRQRQQGAVVIELSPEDYSYEMLSRTLTPESQGSWAKLGAYAVAWKFLLYVLVMKGVTDRPGFKTQAAAKIYQYLRDNQSGIDTNPIGALISYLKRMESFKIGPLEGTLRVRELQRLYRLEEIEHLIPAIAEVCSKQRVTVLVDELDRGWDASEDARGFVAGLFQACMNINQVSPNLRVYISLRQELYDSIPELYEDAQKYRDVIETIRWDESSLLHLVANRIRYSVSALADVTDEQAWSAVFSETLEYRGTKSFNYMIDRTLYRPREIISFCTEVTDPLDASGFPADYGNVSVAEVAYSADRARDIAAEYRFQYPGLMDVFDFFRGKPYSVDRETLETWCLELAVDTIAGSDAAEWAADSDPERLIEVLWSVGFLRAQTVGGVKARRRSGSEYVGPHQVSRLNLRNLNRFQVHPMFRAYLGTKEAKGSAR